MGKERVDPYYNQCVKINEAFEKLMCEVVELNIAACEDYKQERLPRFAVAPIKDVSLLSHKIADVYQAFWDFRGRYGKRVL